MENDLGVLVDDKLTMLAVCPCGLEPPWDPGVHLDVYGQQVKGGDPAPLLDPGEATPGVLGSSVPDRQGTTGEGLGKDHKDDEGVWRISL